MLLVWGVVAGLFGVILGAVVDVLSVVEVTAVVVVCLGEVGGWVGCCTTDM